MEITDLIGQQIDYLKIIKQHSNNEVECKCVCGKKIIKDISYFKNKQIIKSCGCEVSRHSLQNLHSLWTKLSKEEKENWGEWKDFVFWAKRQKYNEVFSYHKKNRKLPYNKENLEFGIFINKEFFNIQRLKQNRIEFDEDFLQFVTSKRVKALIVSDTQITKLLTRQSSKHKQLPDNLFRKLT